MNEIDIVTIRYTPPKAIIYDHNGKCLTVLSLQEAIEYAKTLQYDQIWVFINEVLMENIIKRRTMKTSEKIKDLLDRGMIVEYSSEDVVDPILILIVDEDNDCVCCNKDDYQETNIIGLREFNDDKEPKIKIYRKKYKKLEEGEEVFNLLSLEKETILTETAFSHYSTEQENDVHISSLAPAWYKEKKETITIGGREYNLDDVEDALKDLEEV